MKINVLLFLASCFVFLECYSPNAIKSLKKKDLRLVYQQNFDDKKSLEEFEFTDANAWQYGSDGSLECIGNSNYEPPFRSPLNIGIIESQKLEDFILEVDLQQTGRVYNHQDLCIFFGYQNPSQFYYAHISRAMDDHANQIFIVNKAARTKISTKTNNGQNWKSQKWHRVKLIRNQESGLIQLFFDNMKKPVMEAVDLTFEKGKIGFGTFDDSGKMDNVKIWGK